MIHSSQYENSGNGRYPCKHRSAQRCTGFRQRALRWFYLARRYGRLRSRSGNLHSTDKSIKKARTPVYSSGRESRRRLTEKASVRLVRRKCPPLAQKDRTAHFMEKPILLSGVASALLFIRKDPASTRLSVGTRYRISARRGRNSHIAPVPVCRRF